MTAASTTEQPGGLGVQGSYHWVMTVAMPGRASTTGYGTTTPPPGTTRHDVFIAIKDGIVKRYPELRGADVVFFALEPNQL
ncbi:hypothetical protein ACPCTO_13525 [Streptomyces olivoreticuli]